MKTIISSLFLGLVALVFCFTTVSHAATPAKPAPKAPAKATATVIQSISGDSITVASGSKQTTYKITTSTSFTLNGDRAAASALKTGMRVSVTSGADSQIASQIDASDPVTPAKAPAAAKKGK